MRCAQLVRTCVVALVAQLAGGAEVGTRTYGLLPEGGKPRCNLDEGEREPSATTIVLRFKPADFKGQVGFRVKGPDGTEHPGAPIPSGLKVQLPSGTPPGPYEPVATADGVDVPCDGWSRVGGGVADSGDLAASAWVADPEEGGKKLREVVKSYKGLVPLVHLPSGAVASPPGAPYPDSVAERDRVVVLVVASIASGAPPVRLAVTECGEVPSIRVLEPAGGALKSGHEPRKGEPAFTLVSVGPTLRCGAAEMRYRAGQAHDVTHLSETTLRVRPRYNLAATVFWGFDFAKQAAYSLNDAKRITRAASTTGPALRVGFTWFVRPADLESEGWRADPFLVFDPKLPTEDFAVGFSVSRTTGLAVAVALSVRKHTVLKGKAEGDVLTGDGAVPTEKRWTSEGLGLVVGVTIDTTALARVKTAFSALRK